MHQSQSALVISDTTLSNREIGELANQIHALEDSVDIWLRWRMCFFLLTAVAGLGIGWFEYWAQADQKKISEKQELLIAAKDRQLSEKDRLLAVDLKAKDLAIADAKSESSAANERAAEAEKQAAEAILLAKEYESDIADANARSAEAEKRTIEAKLELEKFRTPRRLTSEQRAQIIDAISPFAGQKYTFWVSPGSEPLGLLGDIDTALTAAKWESEKARDAMIVIAEKWGISMVDGVSIQFAPSRETALAPAVLALGNAIKGAGIEGVKLERSKVRETHPDAIHIIIGSKK